MANYKIEKGIPIPEKYPEIEPFPLFQMEIGDSFFIEETEELTNIKIRARIHYRTKKLKDKKFITRLQLKPRGIRCWRVG